MNEQTHQQHSKIKTVRCVLSISLSTNFASQLDSGRYSVFSHCGNRRCNERVVKMKLDWGDEQK